MFIIRDVSKFAEEDNFEHGCMDGTSQMFELGVSFTGKTADDVIGKFADFLGVDAKDAERNVCDEPGRVEFGITENANGDAISKREIEEWKQGEIKAWYSVYTGYVEELKPVKL